MRCRRGVEVFIRQLVTIFNGFNKNRFHFKHSLGKTRIAIGKTVRHRLQKEAEEIQKRLLEHHKTLGCYEILMPKRVGLGNRSALIEAKKTGRFSGKVL